MVVVKRIIMFVLCVQVVMIHRLGISEFRRIPENSGRLLPEDHKEPSADGMAMVILPGNATPIEIAGLLFEDIGRTTKKTACFRNHGEAGGYPEETGNQNAEH